MLWDEVEEAEEASRQYNECKNDNEAVFRSNRKTIGGNDGRREGLTVTMSC